MKRNQIDMIGILAFHFLIRNHSLIWLMWQGFDVWKRAIVRSQMIFIQQLAYKLGCDLQTRMNMNVIIRERNIFCFIFFVCLFVFFCCSRYSEHLAHLVYSLSLTEQVKIQDELLYKKNHTYLCYMLLMTMSRLNGVLNQGFSLKCNGQWHSMIIIIHCNSIVLL